MKKVSDIAIQFIPCTSTCSHAYLPTLTQPAKDAPDNDHSTIVSIHAIKPDKGTFLVQVSMESSSKEYEDLLLWSTIDAIYSDCEAEYKDDPEQHENFLVLWMQQHFRQVSVLAAKKVAKLRRADIKTLFPGYEAAAPTRVKPASCQVEITSNCTKDHDSQFSYRPESDLYYFEQDRKYSEGRCRMCKEYFPTKRYLSSKKTNQCSAAIRLPSKSHPVYICEQFHSEKTCCGNIICNECYVSKCLTQASKRRRR